MHKVLPTFLYRCSAFPESVNAQQLLDLELSYIELFLSFEDNTCKRHTNKEEVEH